MHDMTWEMELSLQVLDLSCWGIASLLVHFARTYVHRILDLHYSIWFFCICVRALTDYQDTCAELTRHIQPLVSMIKRIFVDAIVRRILPYKVTTKAHLTKASQLSCASMPSDSVRAWSIHPGPVCKVLLL